MFLSSQSRGGGRGGGGGVLPICDRTGNVLFFRFLEVTVEWFKEV